MILNRHKQNGYSLFIVMVLMLVIAFLVIATSQSSLTESRSSANEADRKLALSYAEAGLREGETVIIGDQSSTSAVVFSENCNNGRCKPARGTYVAANVKGPFAYSSSGDSNQEAWERNRVFDQPGITCLQTGDRTACFIIEYLGRQEEADREVFRITSRARGNSNNTVVTLQSYVELIR